LTAENLPPPGTPKAPNPSPNAETTKLGGGAKPVSGSSAKDGDGDADVFLLERLFPEPHEVFHARSIPDPKSDCIVALDTNALLLPYSVVTDDLKDLGNVYSKIADEGRLFLPERVAREFIKNRDRKLADLVQTIGNLKSKINIGESRISPLQVGLAEHGLLAQASDSLAAAKKEYVAALDGLSSQIRSWHGNDPVTSLYASLSNKERLARPTQTNEQLDKEWAYRLRNKIPPGYKDGAKDDRGIGDFAIWMSLVSLGETHKKDVIFVTGEEKADWFVRTGGERIFPRPELVDEYRRASGGRTLRLSSLHDLLREMAAPKDLLKDMKTAELSANSAIIQAALSSPAAAANEKTQDSQPAPIYFAPTQLWQIPPCPASPDGRHDFRNQAALRSRYGGLTMHDLCSRCGFRFDTGEPWD
jgi:hypothetical protein